MSAMHWDLLANYESYELVRRDYETRHNRIPNNRHAREIAAPFTHARSYFRAAQAAEPTVKPLLLYYGVVSLSRGLTLMLSRGLREAALAPSHGLSVKDWTSELSKENPDFTALRVELNKSGSFSELQKATGFQSLLRLNTSVVNYTHVNEPVDPGMAFKLGDIVSRLPALQEHSARWRGEVLCTHARHEKINDHEVRLSLLKMQRPWFTQFSVDAWISGTGFRLEAETPTHVVLAGPNSVALAPGLTDYISPATYNIGDIWMTAPYPGGVHLSKIGTLFLLSYILGMLVRYYPMQWTALIRGQVADAALPTLAAAVETIEQTFPQLVLDFLSLAPSKPETAPLPD